MGRTMAVLTLLGLLLGAFAGPAAFAGAQESVFSCPVEKPKLKQWKFANWPSVSGAALEPGESFFVAAELHGGEAKKKVKIGATSFWDCGGINQWQQNFTMTLTRDAPRAVEFFNVTSDNCPGLVLNVLDAKAKGGKVSKYILNVGNGPPVIAITSGRVDINGCEPFGRGCSTHADCCSKFCAPPEYGLDGNLLSGTGICRM